MQTDSPKISISSLNMLRECERKYFINELKLLSPDNNRFNFITAALKEIASILSQLKIEDKNTCNALEMLNNFIDSHYNRDWFQNDIEYQYSLTNDKAQLTRFLEYILLKNADVIDTNVSYSIKIPNEFIYHCIKIEDITGRVDVILSSNEEIELIQFRHGKPKSSYRAHKELTKIENNLNLICIALGMFPIIKEAKKFKISNYHLVNKDDKGNNILPFENKKGSNIISTTFEKFYVEGRINYSLLLQHFFYVLQIDDDINCEKCFKRSLCKSAYKLFRFNNSMPDENLEVKSSCIAFTESQQKVIQHVAGPMNVIAVPGAGKTKSLVSRVENLILNHNISANNILLLSFTTKACGEILERLTNSLRPKDHDKDIPQISTFNSLGYRILKENQSKVGKIKLASDIDRLMLIYKALLSAPKINNVSYKMFFGKYGLLKQCDNWFKLIEKLSEENFKNTYDNLDTEHIVSVYHFFKDLFRQSGYIDYDDQIRLVNKLFAEYPYIAENYSKLFEYIMVDEAQDINSDQFSLVSTLAKHRNVMLVGDDDQSIYKFRGGSNLFMLEFSKYYPGCETIMMTDNFRSNDKIIEASTKLINNNSNRFIKKMYSHKKAKYKPIMLDNCGKEMIVEYINKLQKKNYSLNDIAIIARKNKPLIDLAEYMSPFFNVTSPKDYMREDSVFLFLLDIFTLYYSGLNNDTSFYRLSNYKNILDNIIKSDENLSLYDNLILSKSILPINCKDIDAYEAYKRISDVNMTNVTRFGFQLFQSFKYIQYSTDILKTIKSIFSIWTDNSSKEVHPVLESLATISEERRIGTIKDLYIFMKNMILYEDTTRVEYQPDKDTVNLLTAHDSKGKQFPVVIIYGIDDFTENDEEDRRLLYVAMTRAEDNLILTKSIGQCNYYEEIKSVVTVA